MLACVGLVQFEFVVSQLNVKDGTLAGECGTH